MRKPWFAFVPLIVILAVGGLARAGPIGNVSEIDFYTQIYELDIPLHAPYVSQEPAYSVDNSSTVIPGGIARIGYYLELDADFVWVSMDAFEQDLSLIGVPTSGSGATFQQTVGNLNVESNVAGLVTGTGITTGNIEFWPNSNVTTRGLPGIGGSDSVHDFNDSIGTQTHGVLQIHNYGAQQTLLSYSSWGRLGGGNDSVGIGNRPGSPHTDWVSAGNTGDYTTRTLEVWVQPVPEPSTLVVLGLGVAGLAARGLRRRRKQLSN